jgi:surface carbohydrate biosynthesis protein
MENNKTLNIAGRSGIEDSVERNFYTDYLHGSAFKYAPRVDAYSTYKLIDCADIVVSVDSTVGYEAIGRGRKTACLSCRGVALKRKDRSFGWPGNFPDNGPFWTSDQDEKQFQRVMDYLNTVGDEEWDQIRQTYANELMEFDPGNTRFVELLDRLLSNQVKLI